MSKKIFRINISELLVCLHLVNMPQLAEAQFHSLAMLRQALSALKEHSRTLKFVFVDHSAGSTDDLPPALAAADDRSRARASQIQGKYLGRKGIFCRIKYMAAY